MPTRHRRLTVGHVHESVREKCFRPASPWQVGVELEWLAFPRGPDSTPAPPGEPGEGRVDPEHLRRALTAAGGLPHLGTITFEPGGQVELSSPPEGDVADACTAAGADLGTLRATVEEAGVLLVGMGADPVRAPARVLSTGRYEAMEAYFAADGPAGRRMMCNTASVQVNVGLHPASDEAAQQWRLANRLGPTLVAAFANSPLLERRPSGFSSARLATWWAIDRTRTAPVDLGRSGPDAYADYALDARVLLVRDTAGLRGPDATEGLRGPNAAEGLRGPNATEGLRGPNAAGGGCVPLLSPLTLRQWVLEGHELGWPTLDDVDYHLSTLFPPVRPRGWLELRMVDALPDPWWQVPVAVVAAILGDPEAVGDADRAVTAAGTADRWVDAARTGMAHPALAASAQDCFDVALAALDRAGTERRLRDMVAAYAERYTWRGRCPADERLDAWADDGTLLPAPGPVASWT